jgi:hypothetical protein
MSQGVTVREAPPVRRGPTEQAGTVPYMLPLAVRWILGESITGLIVRNGPTHGFSAPRRLLRPLNLHEAKLETLGVRSLDDSAGQALANLLSVNRQNFDTMHHGSPVPNTARLFGHVLHENFVSLERRRVCPLCLRDSPHHRAIWNLSVLTVCLEHGCYLLNRCPAPECGWLSWNTASVTTCSRTVCRMSLLEAPVRMAPAEEMDGIRSLVSLIMGKSVPGSPFNVPDSAIRLSFDLGMMAHGRRGFGKPNTLARDHPETVLKVMNAGWSALAKWPQGFHSFLDSLRSQASQRRGRGGMQKEFGALPKWLATMDGQPDVACLADEFATYVAEQIDLPSRTREVRRRRSEGTLRGRFINGFEGADLLGVSYPRLRKIATVHDLWLVPPSGSGAASLLRADKFRMVAEEVAAHLTKKDAGRLLAISKKAFWTLEEMSLLPVIPEQDRILPERLYRRQDVEALLACLEAKAVTKVPTELKQSLVSVDVLARGAVNIGRILAAILAGQLVPQGIDTKAKGLRRLLFERQWLPGALCAFERNMSTADAAVALGVDMKFVYEWVRRGLLHSTMGTTTVEAGHRISEEAFDAFRKEYATGVELAASLGSRSRRFSSTHLMALGLTPVSGPSVDGALMFLFRRSDFANLDSSPLKKFTSGKAPATDKEGRAVSKLITAVGKAAAKILGSRMTRLNNRFVNTSGAIVVQVVTGRRFGFTGAFRFIMAASQIRRLDEVSNGYLALGFVGQTRFLLVPWQKAQPVLRRRSDLKADVCLNVDAAGRPNALDEFCYDLHIQEASERDARHDRR